MWDATIQKGFKSILSYLDKHDAYLLSSSNTAKRCLHG